MDTVQKRLLAAYGNAETVVVPPDAEAGRLPPREAVLANDKEALSPRQSLPGGVVQFPVERRLPAHPVDRVIVHPRRRNQEGTENRNKRVSNPHDRSSCSSQMLYGLGDPRLRQVRWRWTTMARPLRNDVLRLEQQRGVSLRREAIPTPAPGVPRYKSA